MVVLLLVNVPGGLWVLWERVWEWVENNALLLQREVVIMHVPTHHLS